MGYLYRYLTIYNFGDGDIRTSTETSLYKLPDEELNKTIKGYKITIKIDENLYKELNKLLNELEKE